MLTKNEKRSHIEGRNEKLNLEFKKDKTRGIRREECSGFTIETRR